MKKQKIKVPRAKNLTENLIRDMDLANFNAINMALGKDVVYELEEVKHEIDKIDITPRDLRKIDFGHIYIEEDLRAAWGDLIIDALLELMSFKELLKWINEPNKIFNDRTPKDVAWNDGVEHIWAMIGDLNEN